SLYLAYPTPFYFYLFLFLLRPPPTSTLFPYTTLFRSVERLASERRRRAAGDPGGAARTAWLVETASRCCLPTPTCLAKSLVLFLFLRRRGLPAELVIGVTKARGPLEGHAWVRLGGANVGDPLGCIALARLPAERPVAVSLAPCERA